jgi:hypothetical protein
MEREEIVQTAEIAGFVIKIHRRNPQKYSPESLVFMVKDWLT